MGERDELFLWSISISLPGPRMDGILGGFSIDTLKSLRDGNIISEQTYDDEINRRIQTNNATAEALNRNLAAAAATTAQI